MRQAIFKYLRRALEVLFTKPLRGGIVYQPGKYVSVESSNDCFHRKRPLEQADSESYEGLLSANCSHSAKAFATEISNSFDVFFRLEADGGLIKWQHAARNPKQPFARCQVSAKTSHPRFPRSTRNLPLVKGWFVERSSRLKGRFCGRLDGWR